MFLSWCLTSHFCSELGLGPNRKQCFDFGIRLFRLYWPAEGRTWPDTHWRHASSCGKRCSCSSSSLSAATESQSETTTRGFLFWVDCLSGHLCPSGGQSSSANMKSSFYLEANDRTPRLSEHNKNPLIGSWHQTAISVISWDPISGKTTQCLLWYGFHWYQKLELIRIALFFPELQIIYRHAHATMVRTEAGIHSGFQTAIHSDKDSNPWPTSYSIRNVCRNPQCLKIRIAPITISSPDNAKSLNSKSFNFSCSTVGIVFNWKETGNILSSEEKRSSSARGDKTASSISALQKAALNLWTAYLFCGILAFWLYVKLVLCGPCVVQWWITVWNAEAICWLSFLCHFLGCFTFTLAISSVDTEAW